jgi:hypothetical protein
VKRLTWENLFVVPFKNRTGPFQKLTKSKEYNQVVENLMYTQGITREQAEEEYNAYLDNPNDYALNKVSSSIFLTLVVETGNVLSGNRTQLSPLYPRVFTYNSRGKLTTSRWVTNL